MGVINDLIKTGKFKWQTREEVKAEILALLEVDENAAKHIDFDEVLQGGAYLENDDKLNTYGKSKRCF